MIVIVSNISENIDILRETFHDHYKRSIQLNGQKAVQISASECRKENSLHLDHFCHRQRRDRGGSAWLPAWAMGVAENALSRVVFEPGDALIFFSDGSTAVFGRGDEQYVTECLWVTFVRNAALDTQQIHNSILGDVQEPLDGKCLTDDQILLVLKRS